MLNSGYKARHSASPSQEKPGRWPRHSGEVQVPRQAAAHEQAGTHEQAAGPDASRVQVIIIIGLAVALVVIVTFFATPR
jgi:hypothetical protein